MNNNEFHRPFLNSLMIIAGVTVALMVTSRFLISKYNISYQKTSSFTSASLQK